MLAQLPPKQHGYLLVLAALALLILAMVLVLLLSWMWRRYNQRLNRPLRREPMPDLWQAAGDRLTARLDQQHPPARRGPEAVPDDDLPLDPDDQWQPEAESEDEEPPEFGDDEDEDGDAGGKPPRR